MYSPNSDSSLKRAIRGLPTTDLVRLANDGSRSHTYSTSSLQNRPTSSLMREVNRPSTSSLMSPGCGQTSIAISLGQCPENHVYDIEQNSCVSVYSHKFANKALSYALFKANQKK